MLTKIICEDQNIVKVHNHVPISYEITKYVIHHCLEGSGCVAEAEIHHSGFVETLVCNECGFPLVPLFYSYVVVPPSQVYFCKNS